MPSKRKFQPKIGAAMRRAKKPRVSLKAKVAKISRTLKDSLEVRRKEVSGNIQPNTTATFVLLNGMSQGDQDGQREGDHTKLLNVNLRGHYSRNPTSNGGQIAPVLSRMMLITLKDSSAGAPVMADLLQVPADLTSEFVHEGRRNFVVHWDSLTCANYDYTFDNTNQQFETHGYCKLINVYRKLAYKSDYTGNAGTISDLRRNALYLVIVSNHPTTADCPTLNYRAIVKYNA